jgi:hypothetical protein
MALAVCLLFDRRSDQLLREMWARLEEQGVTTLQSHTHGHHHPHLSYAVLLDWQLDPIQVAVAALPDAGPFELTVHGTLTFPRGRAALAPSLPPDIAVRQQRVAEAVAAAGGVLHKHYVPGQWVPHVSVATRANGTTLPLVVKAVADALPLTLVAERAVLVDSTTGRLWSLPVLP